MSDLKPVMVRLPPETYEKLRRQSEQLAIPPAVLARSILTQQLDSLMELNESEYSGVLSESWEPPPPAEHLIPEPSSVNESSSGSTRVERRRRQHNKSKKKKRNR